MKKVEEKIFCDTLDMIDNIIFAKSSCWWGRLNLQKIPTRGRIIRKEVEEGDPSERNGVETRPHVDAVMSLLRDYAESLSNVETQTERGEKRLVAIHVMHDHASGQQTVHHVGGEDEVGAAVFGVEFEENFDG